MIHAHDAIRTHLLSRNQGPDPRFTYHALLRSEWSDHFELLMRNRLVFGAFRYGLLNDPRKAPFNRIQYIRVKLNRYDRTGNLEALVDAANLCLLEFEEGRHPRRHFASMDDTQEHCQIKGGAL